MPVDYGFSPGMGFGYDAFGNPSATGYTPTYRSASVAPVDPVASVGAPSWVAANPFSAPSGTGQVWDGTRAKYVPAPAASGASALPASYTANPTPTSGAGAFGAVPGQLGLPDPGADLKKQLPGLPSLNSGASADILAELKGELSPDTQAAIQDASARFGVTSGMPGSGLVANRTARDFGLTSQQLQQQGLAHLNPFVANTAATQVLSPQLKTSIAETNALNAAAPDPTKAASYAKTLFDQYLAATQGRGTRQVGGSGFSGGGPGGGFVALPNFSAATRPSNFLGANTGYDANGYPVSSYAPGPFPGTNGGAIPQAGPFIPGISDYSIYSGKFDPWNTDPNYFAGDFSGGNFTG